ncbi:MAG TPA: hypothetical protein VK907_11360 [Phnomibacter sp.]|nr:hypothetical protein [Phnomibacter sp.]
MKSIPFIGFVLLLVMNLTLAGCQDRQPPAEDPEIAAKKKAAADRFRNRQATGPMRLANETMQMIWPAYEQLREALVVKDVLKAKEAGLMIAEGTKGQRQFAPVYHAAVSTVGTNNADQQRIFFSPLSNALIDIVRESGMEEGKIFVAFCPMAFDDKGGYWLTAQRKIINPYFGDEMLTCGSIRETIEQKDAPR